MYEQVYGEINEEELFQAARRVYLSARLIDERLGFTADDDVLPLRCHRNIGSNIPHFNTLEFFLELKKDNIRFYYLWQKVVLINLKYIRRRRLVVFP